MSLRLKSLTAAFGISIALWGVLIQGGITLYQSATGADVSETAMMSPVTKPVRTAGF